MLVTWGGSGWQSKGIDHDCSRVYCMTPEEWEGWQQANRVAHRNDRADRPCRDCSIPFAEAQRSIWRCNGVPAQAGRVPLLTPDERVERRRATRRDSSRRQRAQASA